MGIKQLYNDNLRKLPNEYGDVSVMNYFFFVFAKVHTTGKLIIPQLIFNINWQNWYQIKARALSIFKKNKSARLYIHEYSLKLHILSGRGSSVESVSAWHASVYVFDPHVRHIISWRFGHEIISTAILLRPLIQEKQLSVTGERMCTKYW